MNVTDEMRAAVLAELLNPAFLEKARKRVEDELVEWRDSGLSMLGRNNGLTIKSPEGESYGIIRFGFEDGLRIVLSDELKEVTK